MAHPKDNELETWEKIYICVCVCVHIIWQITDLGKVCCWADLSNIIPPLVASSEHRDMTPRH